MLWRSGELHLLAPWRSCYIWHCVPNILLWSILCKTVGLPSSTGESERTARRQFHSPTLRCFRGRLCEVAVGRGPLKQSRWPESNYANPVYGVATICHQIRWLRWGHPNSFNTATHLLIWYQMFCVRNISYRLIWMEFINMFSVYAPSGTHSRFNW